MRRVLTVLILLPFLAIATGCNDAMRVTDPENGQVTTNGIPQKPGLYKVVFRDNSGRIDERHGKTHELWERLADGRIVRHAVDYTHNSPALTEIVLPSVLRAAGDVMAAREVGDAILGASAENRKATKYAVDNAKAAGPAVVNFVAAQGGTSFAGASTSTSVGVSTSGGGCGSNCYDPR